MIKNVTKKTVLAKKKRYAKNDLAKASGLMFTRKKRAFGLVFFFKRPSSMELHTWFVFYPIDVLFLDEKCKVMEMKENFKPFTFYKVKNKAQYFIEVPKGTIKKTKTKIGDKISF